MLLFIYLFFWLLGVFILFVYICCCVFIVVSLFICLFVCFFVFLFICFGCMVFSCKLCYQTFLICSSSIKCTSKILYNRYTTPLTPKRIQGTVVPWSIETIWIQMMLLVAICVFALLFVILIDWFLIHN